MFLWFFQNFRMQIIIEIWLSHPKLNANISMFKCSRSKVIRRKAQWMNMANHTCRSRAHPIFSAWGRQRSNVEHLNGLNLGRYLGTQACLDSSRVGINTSELAETPPAHKYIPSLDAALGNLKPNMSSTVRYSPIENWTFGHLNSQLLSPEQSQ